MSYSIEKLVFYLRGLFSAPIICELSKRKVFIYKKNKAYFDKNAFDKIKGKKELIACLNYLDRIDLIKKLENNNFEFTEMGVEIFKRANSYYVPHSYREYILNLGNILDNKVNIKKLKVDRDENIIGSGKTHMRYFPPVISYLSRNNSYDVAIDVGCGNGHFLNLMASYFNNIELIGFDISNVSVKSAKKIKKDYPKNKINIFKEDASKVSTWSNKINKMTKKKKKIIFFWFLLHEISDNKSSKIIKYLKDVKKNFPDATLVACELTKQSVNIFKKNCDKSLMPEYLLFHDFSNQGILSFSDYRNIISKAGYKVKKEWLFDQNSASNGEPEPSTFVWVLENKT
tara:strand:- start:1047 stop:2075 length:1029 start_codon:yes stop_codon:yes gene_type:complete